MTKNLPEDENGHNWDGRIYEFLILTFVTTRNGIDKLLKVWDITSASHNYDAQTQSTFPTEET